MAGTSWEDLATPLSPGVAPGVPPAAFGATPQAGAPTWGDLATPMPDAAPLMPAAPAEAAPPPSHIKPNLASRGQNPYATPSADDGLAFAGGMAAAAGRGFTFNLSDKVKAVLDAYLKTAPDWVTNGAIGSSDGKSFGDVYHASLDQSRADSDTFQAAHPVASRLAYGAGMLGSLPLLPELAATSLGGKIAQGATVGGGIGAAAGFAGTDDRSLIGDAAGTATGAVAGAGTGGALAGVGELAAKPIVDWFARKFGGDAATQSQALKIIAGKIGQGGPITAQDMLDATNEGAALGKPMALADVGPENLKAYGGQLARAPGESRDIVHDFLNARDKGAGTRLSDNINTGISGGGSVFDTAQALDTARRDAAAPFYKIAYEANNAIQSPVIDEILARPAGKAAFKEAQNLMANDGVPVEAFGPNNLQTLDYVKRALNDQTAAAYKSGANNQGRILKEMTQSFVKALDQADVTAEIDPLSGTMTRPGQYAQARAAYSGPSQSMDAVNLGADFMKKSPSEIAHDVANLEPSDREFYKLGAADALRTSVARTGTAGDEARKLVGSDYLQQQLRPLFDNEADYTRFIDSATAESTMFQTRFNTIGGSHSAGRLREDAGGGGYGPAMGKIMTGAMTIGAEPGFGSTQIGRGVWEALRNFREQNSPAVNAAASRMVFNADQPTNASNLARVLQMARGAPHTPLVSAPMSSLAGQNIPALAHAYLNGGSTPNGQ